ncbi:MAG: glycosyltransferase family 2 protein [Proteobacteria bacterium]|nr:glycosyltransferase family 2 protein [Pseudomonadota bacterium]
MHMRPAIIIPVYNHNLQIADVIHHAQQLGFPIFVVDDGSTDGTVKTLSKIEGINFLRHAVNLGKGAAILTGFAAALEHTCNWAITLDGDGQHNPLDTNALLQVVNEGERCIVIGNRQGMNSDRNVPWTSRFGRKFSNFWVWVAGGPWVEDSQSGFRLYPIPEALHLETKARRYQFEVEILVKAHQQGIKTKEAPIQVVYQERGERISHFRPCCDFLRNSNTFGRLIWARIFSLFRS